MKSAPLPYQYVNAELHERRERVFLIFAGFFLGSMVMLNILGVSRFVDMSFNLFGVRIPFVFAIGVLPYPITFLCTDFISEFYGRRRANFVVLVGLMLNIWVVFIMWLGGLLPSVPEMVHGGMPAAPYWDTEKHTWVENGWAFYRIRALTMGAVVASMIAYLAAQFCDVYLFHFWKKLTKGKHLWLRNNGSTMVSQFVDMFAVIVITFYATGALPVKNTAAPWPELWVFIWSGYIFKLVIAGLDTVPFYIGTYYLKSYLQIDPTQEHNIDEEETRP